MKIRALRPEDDRTTFSCGDEDLDRFFRRFAGQTQFRHHLGSTYVAVDDETDRIVGYATVAAGTIEIEKIRASDRKNLPHYPLPILRLARLGIETTAQGMGIGPELLRFVLVHLAVPMADQLGCFGVLVDAYPKAVSFYARYGFVPVELIAGQSNERPSRTTQMFLAMKTIRASVPVKASGSADE